MRAISYVVILAGLVLLGFAGFDQFRGITSEPVTIGGLNITVSLPGKELTRERDPEAYRNTMAYLWLSASAMLVAGVILFGIVRKQERIDPFSSDLNWKDDE